jgi:hypothetical protein
MKILVKLIVYILAGIATALFIPVFLYAWIFLGIFRPNISFKRRVYNFVYFIIMTIIPYIIYNLI